MKQQVEFARRKVANAAISARNLVVGPTLLTTNANAAATASNVRTTASADVVSTSPPLPASVEINDKTIHRKNNPQQAASSLPERQSQPIINDNDRGDQAENYCIVVISSVAILGIAVILQQSSTPSSSIFIAVLYFILGFTSSSSSRSYVDGISKIFAVIHQQQRPFTQKICNTAIVSDETFLSSASHHDVITSSAADELLDGNNRQRDKTGPIDRQESNSNPTYSAATAASHHYLDKTKKLLSQHSLLGGGHYVKVQRYSNLLHSPTAIAAETSNEMMAILTGRRKVGDDDEEGEEEQEEDEDTAVMEWKRRRRVLFSEGPLMDHLLKYSDFRRRVKKSTMDVTAKVVRASSARSESKSTIEDDMYWEDAEDNDEEEKEKEEEEITEAGAGEEIRVDTTSGTILVGKAKLNNIRASRLFKRVVDPLCSLRGMDLFITDTPEEEIWRQPMLIECGLRDVPTLIANMMLPFGNMTAYFKLPDWFDDWDNIPAEKIDDPPDIRAFKRFLSGDAEYRARAKVIPYIVDGPLAIRMIRPPRPKEVPIHTPRHPATWTQVPKSFDPISGKTNCAILECDVDCVSDKKMRKLINIVRPFMQTITIDMAFIIATPESSSIDDPCACLGLWRVDKVDFDSCAVFPERTIDEVAEEMKLIMSVMEEQCK